MQRTYRWRWAFATAAVGAGALLMSACANSAGSNGPEASSGGEQPVKIAMSVPGPNLYFDNWDRALTDADDEFDFADSSYVVGTTWSLNAQNVTLNALVGRGFNALGIFPGDPEGTNTQLQAMEQRGFTSILVGGCSNDPSPALFCIATEVEGAAYTGAKALIEAIGGEGEIAHLSSQLTDPNTVLRQKGVERAVAETDGKVKLVQFVGDTDTPDAAPRAVDALLAARGETLDGIVATAWYPTEALAAAMKANPEYKKSITVVGADAAEQTVQAIQDGDIYGSIYQNSYGQAYISSYVLQKVVGEGCEINPDFPWQDHPQTSKFIDSGYGLISGDNIEDYIGKGESLPEKTVELQTLVDEQLLSC
jgi:ribose transport system substrate-binding protein